MLHDFPIVPAHMLPIPTVAAGNSLGEGCVLALECNIGAAHDGLSQVINAMADMPCALVAMLGILLPVLMQQLGLACIEGCCDAGESMQAVELVRDGGGEG